MSFKDWKEYELQEVTENYNTLRKPLSSKERLKKQGIYNYYGAQGVIDYIDEYMLEGEYLLIAEDGANLETRNEDIARLTNKNEKFWVNNHAHIIKNNEKSNIIYIKHLLNMMDISPYITGSAQPKLNKNNLNKIKILLPPIEEQKAIAKILSDLDEKIEVNNKINKRLEEMAQSIFKHWFVDFEFPNEDGQPYKSSGGEMIDSELGMIPKGWEVKKVEETTKIIRGASPRPIQEYIRTKGMPWIKISDATQSNSKYICNTKEFIKEEGISKSRFIKKGTLILSNSATPGIPKIVNLDACVHDGWLIFNEFNGISKEYMYYFLENERNGILSLSNGSVFKNLKTDILKNYKIIVPSKDVIDNIQIIFENINKLIKSNVESNERLINLRDTLLPKLMSGEIRVP